MKEIPLVGFCRCHLAGFRFADVVANLAHVMSRFCGTDSAPLAPAQTSESIKENSVVALDKLSAAATLNYRDRPRVAQESGSSKGVTATLSGDLAGSDLTRDAVLRSPS